MTNQLITHRLPIDYSLISLMTLMSSIGYAWHLRTDSKTWGKLDKRAWKHPQQGTIIMTWEKKKNHSRKKGAWKKYLKCQKATQQRLAGSMLKLRRQKWPHHLTEIWQWWRNSWSWHRRQWFLKETVPISSFIEEYPALKTPFGVSASEGRR